MSFFEEYISDIASDYVKVIYGSRHTGLLKNTKIRSLFKECKLLRGKKEKRRRYRGKINLEIM